MFPAKIMPVINRIRELGGKPVLVGGAVRDFLMGFEPKDFDFEIFEMQPNLLLETLREFGDADIDGEEFAVFHLTFEDELFDFSIPRTEVKTGKKENDFEASFDPFMTFALASERRDFTINAIGWDGKQFLDPHNGMQHIEEKLLVPTSVKFRESPVRVLRGFQFAARFGFTASEEFVTVANSMVNDFGDIAQNRLAKEWMKWAEKGEFHALGLEVLRQTGWLVHFPELNAIIGIPQDKKHHPEGDVWTHTLHTITAMNTLCKQNDIVGLEKAEAIFGAMGHDFGKENTTVVNADGTISSHRHEITGEEKVEAFMNRIFKTADQKTNPRITDFAMDIARWHMAQHNNIDFRTVSRLARKLRVATIHDVWMIMKADVSARPFNGTFKDTPAADKMLAIAAQEGFAVEKPVNILMGRHLKDMGLKPGIIFGQIIKASEEAQDAKLFTDVEGAKLWVKETFLNG